MVATVLVLALALAAPTQVPQWSAGPWASAGSCRVDGAGAARRAERRAVACMDAAGRPTRTIDCDAASKPASERSASCSMDWSCTEWRGEVYAEASRTASLPFEPGRGVRIPATAACANAKQADPSGVDSCRASLSERVVETLSERPTSFTGNGNYAWIGCERIAR